MAQASFEPGTSRFRVLRSAAAPHWLGKDKRNWQTLYESAADGFTDDRIEKTREIYTNTLDSGAI